MKTNIYVVVSERPDGSPIAQIVLAETAAKAESAVWDDNYPNDAQFSHVGRLGEYEPGIDGNRLVSLLAQWNEHGGIIVATRNERASALFGGSSNASR